MTENDMKKRANTGVCPYSDIVFGLFSYAFLLIIDPLIATIIGVPLCVVAFVLRYRWWPKRPIAGGLVMATNVPICALGVACVFAFGSFSLFLGTALAFATLALAEWLNRRAGRSFVRRFTLTAGLFFFLLTFLFAAFLLETGLASFPTEELVKVVSEAPEAPKWRDESKAQALAVAYFTVENGVGKETMAAPQLTDEPSPHGVYVTLYDKYGHSSRGVALTGVSSAEKVAVATADALSKNPKRARFKKEKTGPWRVSSAATRIQIDVAGPPRRTTIRPFFYFFAELIRGADSSLKRLEPLGELLNLGFQIESGVDGLLISGSGEESAAVMLPSDPVTRGWLTPRVRSAPGKVRQMLRRTWRRRFGENLDLENDYFSVKKFRTASFGALGPGEPVINWFRGNVLADEILTRKKLIEGTVVTADWLSRQVKSNGKFYYEKYPPYKNGTSDYNLPRHAGSVYGLFAMHQASKKHSEFQDAGKRALEAGTRALRYIGENLGTPAYEGQPGHLCFLDKKKRAASGSTALAAISVAQLTDAGDVHDPTMRGKIEEVPRDEWLRGMGNCMLQMIDSSGAVFAYYRDSRTQEAVIEEPLYFPGEVMLALTRIYKKIGDERFLEGAKKIGARQLKLYKWPMKLDFPLPGDHWIMQALSELAVIADERSLAELSVLMGYGYLREQHPPQEYLYPDYRGGYRRIADLPRTTRAASRGEALGGAMDAARFLGEDSGNFENGLIDGARHLLEQQFVKENSYFVPATHDVVGGIRMGLVDNHLRIDNNQHSLVALLRALEAMDHRK